MNIVWTLPEPLARKIIHAVGQYPYNEVAALVADLTRVTNQQVAAAAQPQTGPALETLKEITTVASIDASTKEISL